jgi:hypothetical protein
MAARLLALVLCAAGCAKADSSSDAGANPADARPLVDGGRVGDGGGDDPDAGGGGEVVPVINEFVADHTGTDSCEYVEIAGSAGTDYGRYAVIAVEGDGGNGPGVVQVVVDVGMTRDEGVWVSGFLANQLQNGSSSLLLVADFTGGVGTDIDRDDDGTIDNQPWSALVDAVAVDDGDGGDLTYAGTAVLVESFDGGNQLVGGASRLPNAEDSDQPGDWTRNKYSAEGLACAGSSAIGTAANTPGATNSL